MVHAAQIIANRARADAVVLISYVGVDKSVVTTIGEILGGAVLAGVTLGAIQMGPSPEAITEVVLIDGISREVIWGETGGGALGSDILGRAMDEIPHDVAPDYTRDL